jgi:hypothetical protein
MSALRNAIFGLKEVHNTVRHLRSFFGCSSEFARMYYQAADVDGCIDIAAAREALLVSDVG